VCPPALLREQPVERLAGVPDNLHCLLHLGGVSRRCHLFGGGVQPVHLGAQVQVRGLGRGPGGQVAQLARVGQYPPPLGQLVDLPAIADAAAL